MNVLSRLYTFKHGSCRLCVRAFAGKHCTIGTAGASIGHSHEAIGTAC